MVYLNHGPSDLYSAIDSAFDLHKIEDSSGRYQYKTIKSLPPILQFRVTRVGFDPKAQTSFKIDHQLKLYDCIYMDRYMADPERLAMRKQSWEWQSELKRLQEVKKQSMSPNFGLEPASSLQGTTRFMFKSSPATVPDEQITNDLESSENDAIVAEAQSEQDTIDAQIARCEARLSEPFTDDPKLKYNLHAVFVHRGDSTRGHWFIYIRDPVYNAWRQYNDETVSIVSDTSAIFEPEVHKHGTSAFVVYIRDQEESDIVETVCRAPIQAGNPEASGDSDSLESSLRIVSDHV